MGQKESGREGRKCWSRLGRCRNWKTEGNDCFRLPDWRPTVIIVAAGTKENRLEQGSFHSYEGSTFSTDIEATGKLPRRPSWRLIGFREPFSLC